MSEFPVPNPSPPSQALVIAPDNEAAITTAAIPPWTVLTANVRDEPRQIGIIQNSDRDKTFTVGHERKEPWTGALGSTGLADIASQDLGHPGSMVPSAAALTAMPFFTIKGMMLP